MDKFLIIDGNSLLFRAFYATNHDNILRTSDGVYTNAIYGFAKMINIALETIKPNYIAIAFDKGKKTFRHDLYQDYKAGRKQTPIELVEQFALSRELLKAYNIQYLEKDGIEADDIIGSLSQQFKDEVFSYILSSDNDMLQLVDDHTNVLLIKRGMSDILEITKTNFYQNYAIYQNQIVDYKALKGDSSDNIKGVAGIGEKTAIKLLNEYSNLENIYQNIDQIKGKIKDKLLSGKQDAFLSRQIATILRDCELDVDLSLLKLNLTLEPLQEFFNRYEMYSLIRELSRLQTKEISNEDDRKYQVVKSVSKQLLQENALIYFFYDEIKKELKKVVIIYQENIEIILLNDFLNDTNFLKFLDSNIHKYTIDLKLTKHVLSKYSIHLNNFDDLFLMSFLINNNINNLAMLFKYYQQDLSSDTIEVLGSKAKSKPEESLKENLALVEIGYKLEKIINLIKIDLDKSKLSELYYGLELPLTHILFEMEKQGVCISIDVLDQISAKLNIEMERIKEIIYHFANKSFNLNSPKELSKILFEDLGLKSNKKQSTSIEILENIRDQHPIIDYVIEYRSIFKLYSTYSFGLKKYISDDQKIHTTFTQTITSTGRLSSYNPNLQNLTVRSAEGKKIRKAFIPLKDYVFVSCDYSQIELRILASLAREENLIKAFNENQDIHAKTASDIFGVNLNEVTSDLRRKAKAINFGIIYGISAFGLSKQVNISIEAAKEFIDTYFERYPNIKKYTEIILLKASQNGYVETISKRRRYINNINSSNYLLREQAKREALNAPIQGSCADIIKHAMINIDRAIKKHNLDSHLLLQIHDELIFQVKKTELDQMSEIIKKGMYEAYQLDVKLDFDFIISDSLYIEK